VSRLSITVGLLIPYELVTVSHHHHLFLVTDERHVYSFRRPQSFFHIPYLSERVERRHHVHEMGTNYREGLSCFFSSGRCEVSDRTSNAQAQLRWASQRLAQVQARNDALANITWKDIATLLQRSDISVARDKAEKLILDEAYGDFLEELIMQIGVLLEHFLELERGYGSSL
jgi:hypothetical protein